MFTDAHGQERQQTPAEVLCGVQGSGKLFLARLADDLFRAAGWTRETDDFIIWYVPPAGMSTEEAKRFSDSVMYRVYGILPRGVGGGEG